MGGRRLPRSQALKWLLLAIGSVSVFAASACFFGSDDDDEEPTPTPAPSATNTVEPTASPSATPTPNLLATPPTDQTTARAWLEVALRQSGSTGSGPSCPPDLGKYGVLCAEGDADGDAGQPDRAYLVPLTPRVPLAPHPAAVFVQRSTTGMLEELSSAADASIIGAGVFAVADRTSDALGDITYLENVCSATGCKTAAIVMAWDGTAWRNVGPVGEPVGNVDTVTWTGSGSASRLTIHGGKLPEDAPKDAGPTRAATRTFRLSGPRYALESEAFDPPQYLYHAILDAERTFVEDKRASITEFQAAANNTSLMDWRPPGAAEKDRRPALQGFALFRIALAHAAIQSDPLELTEALDDVVNHGVDTGEPLFVNVTEEFRRGYASNGLTSGCAAVAAYINKVVPGTDTRGYISATFNYGYENPPGSAWANNICPF